MSNNSRSAIKPFIERLLERSALSDEEIGALSALEGHTTSASANVDIVSPGQISSHACLMVEGLAGSFGQIIDGRRQITALHLAGDMCDLKSIVLPGIGGPLQTLSSAVILRIAHRDLDRVASDYPSIAKAFWRDCAVDASILSQWVTNVGRRDGQSRLAHFLCEMAVRLENVGLGSRTEFRLQISQTQLGDVLGLTPVHINRVFKSLRRGGLISVEGRIVRIGDWNALARLGDFEEDYLHVSGRLKARERHAFGAWAGASNAPPPGYASA